MVKVNYPPQLQAELLPESALPDFIYALPEMALPEKINLAQHFLDRNLVGEQADRVAFYYGDRQVTYRGLHELVNRFANALRGLGIGAGDRVIMRIPTSIEFAVVALALNRLGAVAVPTMPMLREKVLTLIANDSEAKAMVCMHDLIGEVEAGIANYKTVKNIIIIEGDKETLKRPGYLSYEELIESSSDQIESVMLPGDALTAVFFSSGTTGTPKGSMHLQRNVIALTHISDEPTRGVFRDDIICGSPPLAFTYGYGFNLLFPLYFGIPCVLIEGRVSAEKLLVAIQKHRVTIFNCVPTAYNQMLNLPDVDKYDLSSLRVALCGTAPLLPSTFNKWKALSGLELINCVGSSESFGTCFSTAKPGCEPGSIGYPPRGLEAKVIDEEGKTCSPGTPGRLVVRGCLGTMYWHNPEVQKEVVIDGWSMVGDLGYQDETGCFWHISRSDDVIKSRGYRVSPGEVEDALKEHPWVFEAAVIGVPDEIQGHRVKAFVMLKTGFESSPALVEEMRAFVKARVAPYQAPSEIEYVQALPMTETGKIRRVELRELEAKRAAERPAAENAGQA